MTHYADVDAITGHIEKHIGPIHTVFHEIVSDDLHIDIHHVKSTLFRRYEVLVTTGMSALPMAVPEGEEQPKYAEVVTILPKGWPLTKDAFADENNYWPLRLMKDVARLPHYGKTWIGYGHTMANGASRDDTTPYAPNTRLCATAILPPLTLGEDAWVMRREDGNDVYFWSLLPLHMNELQFKMQHGMDALLDVFDKRGVSDMIDPARRSAV